MIRPITPNDFEFIHGLYFHPQVNPYLLYEMTESVAFQPIFDDLLHRKIVFIYSSDSQPVGMFKLYPHTFRSNHIGYLGGVAIHPDFAGQGHGLKMMQEILNFSKEEGFLRIELSTATTNEKAISLYEKVGFQKEGIMRRYTYLKSENRFLDEILMSYLF